MSEALTLEQLLVYVEQAVRGDRRLLVQLFRELQRLARHPTAPPEEKALAELLCRVLMGDERPDVSHLPESMQQDLRALFARLQTS